MATITYVIKTADRDSRVVTATKHVSLIEASKIFQGLVSGAVNGTVDVYKSSTDPVAASGSVALTYASVAANDTVTILNQVITCKASGAVAGTEFNKQTDGPTTATNLATAINANTVLSQLVTASAATSTVTITSKIKGLFGNGFQLSTSNGTGFTITAFASGAGGPVNTAASF